MAYRLITGYLIIINLAAFLTYGVDKRKAQKKRWRISERILLGLAFVGGSLGALCGMYLFRHKTRKTKFVVSVPVLLALHLGIGCYILMKSYLQ